MNAIENYQLNLISWTVECLSNRVGHELEWEWILAVDEMVNSGDASMLHKILEDERENCAEEKIVEISDAKRRIEDIAERLGQYPYERMSDVPSDKFLDIVCEITALAFTDNESEREGILGREVEFIQ